MRCLRRLLLCLFLVSLTSIAGQSPPAAAAGAQFVKLVRAFVKEVAGEVAARASEKVLIKKFDEYDKLVPGLRQAAEALAKHAKSEEEDVGKLGLALANELIYALFAKGIKDSTNLACSACISPIFLAEGASVYSDRAAVQLAISSGDPLLDLGPVRYLGPDGQQMVPDPKSASYLLDDYVAPILVDALEQMRGRPVSEDGFEKAASVAVRNQNTETPTSRWLRSISFDDSKGTLDVEIHVAGINMSIIEIDVKTYASRLKNLLAFGAGVLLDPDDNSREAEEARKEKSAALKAACKGDKWSMSNLGPAQCGHGLGPGGMADMNRDFLVARSVQRIRSYPK